MEYNERKRVRKSRTKVWTVPSDGEIDGMLCCMKANPQPDWMIFYNWKLGMVFHVKKRDVLTFGLSFVLDNLLIRLNRSMQTNEMIKQVLSATVNIKDDILKDISRMERLLKDAKREDFSNEEYLVML